jgi:hypothetical protein
MLPLSSAPRSCLSLLRAAAAAVLLAGALGGHAAVPEPEPDHDRFEQAVRQAVTPAVASSLAGLKVLHLSGDVGPWLDTGLALSPGQPVTLLMRGRLWWSRAARLSLSPALAVWAQVGPQGEVFNGTRDTHGFVAAGAGNLRLKLFPGLSWTDPHGAYEGEPPTVNPDAGGGVSVAVLAWKPGTDVAAQLQALARHAPLAPWAQGELSRLAEGTVPPPEGWHYYWPLGRAEIFSRARPEAGDPDGGAIAVHTHDDVGILQKDAPFELRPGTRLQWRWRVDALPSTAPEDSVPTHDYLSLAVEFDNGRDLTFMWSQGLPQGHVFACPLPAWQQRETHLVTRSGTVGLGQWQAEEVDLFEAYRHAVGGPMPARVTRVWLIANSVFEKHEGRARFAGIALVNGQRRLQVD